MERHISAVKGFRNETKLKGIVHPKINSIHHHDIPNPHTSVSSVELKRRSLSECPWCFFNVKLILDRMRHSFVQIISNYLFY